MLEFDLICYFCNAMFKSIEDWRTVMKLQF